MNNSSIQEDVSCPNINKFKTDIFVPTYITVFIFGFIQNVFCLYIFLKLFKRKTAFSIVMVNLAISDLLFVCTLPWRVHYYLNDSKWKLSHAFCIILTYALYLNMYCSIYFLTLISVLRYFAVVHPMKCLKYRNVRSVQIMCVAVWVFVGAVSSPLQFSSYKTTNEAREKCFEFTNALSQIYPMNLFSLIVGCIIPFFTITVCYIFVVKTLLTSKITHHQQVSSRRKAVAVIIIVTIIFLTSFLPYHIIRTAYLTLMSNKKTASPAFCFVQIGSVVTLCIAAINPCLDPFLYYFAAENFRDKLTSTLQNILKVVPLAINQT
ncbi:cysteinyl leukotriene receptor 2-like [Rhincodon typus]|uniref:cysteinyl leukotriene receptor 2-like n=1 Tax=Rhincodon typus TaxID=259920 RepID=UPI0009A43EB2|nr:cysteinyl leukotriene receptor 2-like [Rhincodon typus]XP_048459117.1 cysteinyl leukotriene receptor 2-like [Rhincodon typus]